LASAAERKWRGEEGEHQWKVFALVHNLEKIAHYATRLMEHSETRTPRPNVPPTRPAAAGSARQQVA
jgi:hypothetical protein